MKLGGKIIISNSYFKGFPCQIYGKWISECQELEKEAVKGF